jgi:hypothetical protein
MSRQTSKKLARERELARRRQAKADARAARKHEGKVSIADASINAVAGQL